jgi:hypothetical protein
MSKPIIGIEAQSHALVRALAQELNQTPEEVRDVYDRQLRRLDGEARIKTFLPIFAARHARRILAKH